MTSVAARVLAAADAQQRVNKRHVRADLIAAQTGIAPLQVRRALNDAAKRGLVKPAIGHGLRPIEGAWVVTKAGRQAVAGNMLESGVTHLSEGDLRTRAWRAIRLQRNFSVETVLNVILNQDPATNFRSAHVRLCRYLCQLEALRVVVCTRRTRAGKAFVLADDLGPLAPVPRPASARLWDPNAERFVERPKVAELLPVTQGVTA